MCYNIAMYIEFVIADNFLLTYLAGCIAARICRNKACVWRTLLAATVGTVVAVFYPFFNIGAVALLFVKLALWIILCIIMYIKTPRAVTESLAFLACTFAFGGASYAIGLIVYSSSVRAEEFCRKCPTFLVLGGGATVYAAVRFCVKRLRIPYARAPYEYGTEIEVFGKCMKFDAFLDTGNCVFDGRTGLPVVITDLDSFIGKLDGAGAAEFARKLPKIRRITAKTPAGSTEIYLVEPSRITVYSDRQGHKINAMIGLVGGENRFTKSHEMLLNPAAMTEGV